MAEFQASNMTRRGAELLAASQSGGKLLFTDMAFGDALLSGSLLDAVGLAHEVQRFEVVDYRTNGEDFAAWSMINGVGLAQGYYVREMGLYCADPAYPDDRTRDILYAVSEVTPEPGGRDYFAYIPPDGTNMAFNSRVIMHVPVSPTSDVSISSRASLNFVSREELNEIIGDINAALRAIVG